MVQTKNYALRSRDMAFKLSSGEVVSVWINQDIFTKSGHLQPLANFSGGEENSFLMFDWPNQSRSFTTFTYCYANIQAPNDERLQNFDVSSAENLGSHDWEFVKLVTEKCLTNFHSYVLEVTSCWVKLGHLDVESAQLVHRKKNNMVDLLMNLYADTEVLFMDVQVEWDVRLMSTPVSGKARFSLRPEQSFETDENLHLYPPRNSNELATNTDMHNKVEEMSKNVDTILGMLSHLNQKVDSYYRMTLNALGEQQNANFDTWSPTGVLDSNSLLAIQQSGIPEHSSETTYFGEHLFTSHPHSLEVDGEEMSTREQRARSTNTSLGSQSMSREYFLQQRPNSGPDKSNSSKVSKSDSQAKLPEFKIAFQTSSKPPESAIQKQNESKLTNQTSSKPVMSNVPKSLDLQTENEEAQGSQLKKIHFQDQSEYRGQGTKSQTSIPEMDRNLIRGDTDDETELVRASVDRAYEPDKEDSPKAKSFDTILCLDISESMRGEAFDEMKKTALSFIDGVEDMVNETGVEENIGLVTFGGRANVIQNLTNDFSRLREKIDVLIPGGNSPFVEALLVSMAAFVKKGGIVSVSGEWDVRPRIIFISDGVPTESTKESKIDTAKNNGHVRTALARMLYSFQKSEQFQKVHPIVFVPVGEKADIKYMKSMSELCDGGFCKSSAISDLCSYFWIQELIGKVMACVRDSSGSLQVDQIKAFAAALASVSLTPEQLDGVVATVNLELENPAKKRRSKSKPDDFDNIFEDEDKVKSDERLPLGTRVVRGVDWDFGNQDGNGPGTVLNHEERYSWHWVLWDTGDYNRYPYSPRRGYHIKKVDDLPRKSEGQQLEIGMTVKKGPDWKDSDSKVGVETGIIIRKSSSQKLLMVRWSNGEMQKCHWSPEGPHEVVYCGPQQDSRQIKKPILSNISESNQKGSEDLGRGIWEWKDVNKMWHAYDQKTNKALEKEYQKRPYGSCHISRDGKNRRVMFRRKVEKVIEDNSECEVRRI